MKDERQHSIDKLFHESLDGQEVTPSAGLWASLEKHVPATSAFSLLNYLLSAVAVGLLSVGLILLMNPAREVMPAGDQIQQADILPDEAPASVAVMPKTGKAEETAVTDNMQARIAEEKASIQANAAVTSPELPKPARTVRENAVYKPAAHLGYAYLQIHECLVPAGQQYPNTLTGENETTSPVFSTLVKDDYVRKADLLFGAGFSPAVNIYPDGQNRNDFSVELLAAYEKSRFIVEGGLGITYTSESAKYGIQYSSYDSIGYFINVNSFGVDPRQPGSVWFETSLKGIYDSIQHYRIEEKTNKYAYLQLPLRIGYRLLEKNRFSIDAKLGILFSLQVYKDVPDIPYEGSDVNRIDVIRYYPDRLKTHWQYTASLGVNYDISRQIRLSVEPFYRQFIKSVYTSGSDYSARSPYAFGIRGTLYFHL